MRRKRSKGNGHFVRGRERSSQYMFACVRTTSNEKDTSTSEIHVLFFVFVLFGYRNYIINSVILVYHELWYYFILVLYNQTTTHWRVIVVIVRKRTYDHFQSWWRPDLQFPESHRARNNCARIQTQTPNRVRIVVLIVYIDGCTSIQHVVRR